MDKKDIPCCAADAMRTIRQVNVDGIVVGLSMLDCIFEEIRLMDLKDDTEIREELIRRVQIYNYVPRSARDRYADAVLAEYRKEGT